MGDRRYCYPLTVTDHASRRIMLCEALDSTRELPAIEAFERLFRDRGLPDALRSDNGLPFASPNGLYKPLKAVRLGGSGSASPSSASNPAIPSRTDATSACISPSSRKPPGRRP